MLLMLFTVTPMGASTTLGSVTDKIGRVSRAAGALACIDTSATAHNTMARPTIRKADVTSGLPPWQRPHL